MKLIYYYVFLIFFLTSCTGDRIVYLCGKNPCANKKEKEEYFKKTMIVESIVLDKKLIKNESEVEKIKEKVLIEEKKKKTKSIFYDETKTKKYKIKKSKIKKEKKLFKKSNEIKEIKETEKSNSISKKLNFIKEKTKFDNIAKSISDKNSQKSFPDINNIPN